MRFVVPRLKGYSCSTSNRTEIQEALRALKLQHTSATLSLLVVDSKRSSTRLSAEFDVLPGFTTLSSPRVLNVRRIQRAPLTSPRCIASLQIYSWITCKLGQTGGACDMTAFSFPASRSAFCQRGRRRSSRLTALIARMSVSTATVNNDDSDRSLAFCGRTGIAEGQYLRCWQR